MNDQLSLQRLGCGAAQRLAAQLSLGARHLGHRARWSRSLVSLASAYDGDVGRGRFLSHLLHRRVVRVGHDRDERVLQRSARPRRPTWRFCCCRLRRSRRPCRGCCIHTVGLRSSILLVFTTVLSWVLEGINTLRVRRAARVLLAVRSSALWLMLPHFLVAQALFFLGAAWFRKVHFVKTVGAALAIALGLGCIVVAIAWLLGGRVDATDGSTCDGDRFDRRSSGSSTSAPFVYFYRAAARFAGSSRGCA